METGGFHGQGFSAGSDPDDSSYHETSSTTTNYTITPISSTRRYSVAGVIRSLFHAVLVQDTEHLDHVMSSLSLDPNKIRDKDHKTMLMVAATENKHCVLRYLLALPSIDVDQQDDEGETALYQAAAAGSTECVQLLLLAGASTSLGNEEAITPLIIASYNGFLTICRLLISIGHANVNQQDNTQKSALLLASYAGHVDVLALLIEQGASLNILDQYGWSSLMLAAYAGKLDACKLLLSQGADPHIKTANGKNARSLSWDAGHKSIAVYITRFLTREGSNGGGTSSIISTTSGPGSGVSTRTLIQQMLPPVPRTPSRRTHSPAPSLPSVPEESQEEEHYRPRRSFSGYNSTVSRHSSLSSRLSAPPKARRHQSLPAAPLPTQSDESAPSSPTSLPPSRKDLSAIFIPPKEDSPDTELETSPFDATPSNLQGDDTMAMAIAPTAPTTSEPAIHEMARPRIQWRAATPRRIYSVTRRGVIPRYGTKHIHFYVESSLENTDPIFNRSGSNYHQQRVQPQEKSSNSLAERAKEKDMESDINRRIRKHMKLIERNRNHIWVLLSNFWTVCCPARILPRSWSVDGRQDWREKVTICSLVSLLVVAFGFLAFGLALLTCRPHSMETLMASEFAARYGNRSTAPGGLATIRGVVYDVGAFFAGGFHPSSTAGGSTTEAAINLYLLAHYGGDVSALFPPLGSTDICQLFGASTNFGKCSVNNTAINHCHSFSPLSNDLLRRFERSDVVVTYPWPEIVDSKSRSLFVYDGSVFDATDYLAQVPGPTITTAEISRMYWIRSLIGRDATLAIRKQANYRGLARCFQAYFKVGVVSGQSHGGCLASIVINTFALAILLLITLMRLGSALVYRFFFSQPIRAESGKDPSSSTSGPDNRNNSGGSGDSIDNESHVLMLVTCQATDENDQIRRTLDSLALTDHDDGRKLLLVMADATWDDDGERSLASLACLRLMHPLTANTSETEKSLLQATSDDPFSEDIYSGYYVAESRRIPYILVLRAPDQDHVLQNHRTWWKKKLILRWLYRVCFNEPISSFEYALFERVRGLMGGGGPDVFDMLLTAEIGIECDRCSLSRMVGTLRRSDRVMGVCAQRVISNGTENWLTRIQDYENHLSLQFTNAFESTLSAVQCLPNRLSLVRIKIRRDQGSHYPGQVKFDKRNSDDTSVLSDTDDDEENQVRVKGRKERGGSGRLENVDAEVDEGAGDETAAAGNHQGTLRRTKRQRMLKKVMALNDTHYSVPILIHPNVISSFVGNKARTLHERSVLLQGAEDRYLAGLLHQTFPDRRIVYVPQAIYRSTVSSYLRSFLQEQSVAMVGSFHVLWRQIWIPELRGLFCCSLNFLALVDWLALVILPSVVVFSWALLVMVAVGAARGVGALDVLPVVLALSFMVAVLALQPLLGICLGGGQRNVARNLHDTALFLAVMPFKYLVVPYFLCFHGTQDVGSPFTEGVGGVGSETPRNTERRLRHWAEWHSMRRSGKIQSQSQIQSQSPSQSPRRHTSLSRLGSGSGGSGVRSPSILPL